MTEEQEKSKDYLINSIRDCKTSLEVFKIIACILIQYGEQLQSITETVNHMDDLLIDDLVR